MTNSCLVSRYRQNIESPRISQNSWNLSNIIFTTPAKLQPHYCASLYCSHSRHAVESPKLDSMFSPSRFQKWFTIVTTVPENTQVIFVRNVKRRLLWLFLTVEYLVQVKRYYDGKWNWSPNELQDGFWKTVSRTCLVPRCASIFISKHFEGDFDGLFVVTAALLAMIMHQDQLLCCLFHRVRRNKNGVL